MAAPNNKTRVEYEQDWNQYPSRTQEVSVPGETIDFDIGSLSLKKGVNELEIRQVSLQPARREPLILKDVKVAIDYH